MAFERFGTREFHVVSGNDPQTIRDALKLAHDGGVESGFLEPNPTGLRFDAPFLNPGTRFTVVYADDVPVASEVAVEDGPFGLPCEHAFGDAVEIMRSGGFTLNESTCYNVASNWRRVALVITALLFAPVLRHMISQGGTTKFLMVVEPRSVRVDTEIFGHDVEVGPRDYMGLPGTLLASRPASTLADYYLDPAGLKPRRVFAERLFDPEPEWMTTSWFDGNPWETDDLVEAVQVAGLADSLSAQWSLLPGAAVPSGVNLFAHREFS